MGKNINEIWAARSIGEGWTWGIVRNDDLKQHPCLISYEELPESKREYNRNTAMNTLKIIMSEGYVISNTTTSLIDSTVVVGNNVQIGHKTIIKGDVYLGNNCQIGSECKIHRNVFIDENVVIGDRVKIENNSSIYGGVIIEDGVFVGPNITFTNDKYPRSITSDGRLKDASDWICV